MKIVNAQISSTTNKETNLEKAIKAIKEAKKEEADLILFPEMYMFYTSINGIVPKEVAEPLNGEFVKRLSEAAKEHKIYVVCGVHELDNIANSVYNSVVTINKSGELISSYRKTHLCDSWNVNESDLFKAGKKPFEIIETEFGKIGILICYELRFPEISRYLTNENIDILLVPAAWYSGGYKEEHWIHLVKARAIENTIFVCAVNQAQEPFCGRSTIIDPMGVMLSSAGKEEQLISGKIDVEYIKKVREVNPCLNNIVDGIYN